MPTYSHMNNVMQFTNNDKENIVVESPSVVELRPILTCFSHRPIQLFINSFVESKCSIRFYRIELAAYINQNRLPALKMK